jgi:hypothetical protein
VDSVTDPLLLIISGSAGNRTRDPWIFGQELLDNKGGRHIGNHTLKRWRKYTGKETEELAGGQASL